MICKYIVPLSCAFCAFPVGLPMTPNESCLLHNVCSHVVYPYMLLNEALLIFLAHIST